MLAFVTRPDASILDREFAARIDSLAEILARLEVRNVLAGQGHCLTGLGIPADSRGPEMQRETPEASNLDALPLGQRIAHQIQQVLDRKLDVFRRQVLLLAGNGFYEFRFSHNFVFTTQNSVTHRFVKTNIARTDRSGLPLLNN